jgi:hypothetical protein
MDEKTESLESEKARSEASPRPPAPSRPARKVVPAPPPPRAEPARRGTEYKPGRNDLCWCGSGKKYKKCHMASDEA